MEDDFRKDVETIGLVKTTGSGKAYQDSSAASELRQKFAAAIGHDLRNPLAAIIAGIEMLSRTPPDDKTRQIAWLMQNSAQNLNRLIDNVLDFVSGQFGSELLLERECAPLEPVLRRTVDAISSSCPDRRIETSFKLAYSFDGDHARIGQLFANLLGYAVSCSAADAPIRVDASDDGKEFKLIVANADKTVPPALLERLFQPKYFGQFRKNLLGICIGLHVASEIARAHGGELNVTSHSGETRFALLLPISRQQDTC